MTALTCRPFLTALDRAAPLSVPGIFWLVVLLLVGVLSATALVYCQIHLCSLLSWVLSMPLFYAIA